jgi:hypothetical protein
MSKDEYKYASECGRVSGLGLGLGFERIPVACEIYCNSM